MTTDSLVSQEVRATVRVQITNPLRNPARDTVPEADVLKGLAEPFSKPSVATIAGLLKASGA